MAIIGTTGNDVLLGTSGKDTITGLEGDDTLTGGAAVDVIDGGAGTDTVDYGAETGTGGVIVNLSASAVTVGGVTVNSNKARDSFGASDSLISIENARGGAADDVFYGSAGVNVFDGGAGNDVIYGGGGQDRLDGGDGNDILYAASSNGSQLSGGAGDDILYIASSIVNPGLSYDIVDGGDGYDIVHVTGTFVQMLFNTELIILDETPIGSPNSGIGLSNTTNHAETIIGNSGVNVIRAGGGDDVLQGGGGNDVLEGGPGADSIDGGSGADTADYEMSAAVVIDLEAGTASGGYAQGDVLTSIENLVGSRYDDVLRGDAGANTLDGQGGADILEGRGGDDVYLVDDVRDVVIEAPGGGIDEVRTGLTVYTLGSEIENLSGLGFGGRSYTLTGNAMANVITGSYYNDVLYGLDGSDTLIGDLGNDVLDGGIGEDMMIGGRGNDTYIVDSEGDVVVEADAFYMGIDYSGTDTVRTDLYAYTLGANVDNLTYIGLDYFFGEGNALANVITGGGGEDFIVGGDGNDSLYGSGGDDYLVGDAGDDLLVGGVGSDSLEGGAGADTFRFDDGDAGIGYTGPDYITDFVSGVDRIDLSPMDAITGTSGDDAFTFVGTAAFTGTAGELRYYASGGNTVVEGDLDGDGAADMSFVLVGAVTPIATDFVL